jgi:hypothetical protein
MTKNPTAYHEFDVIVYRPLPSMIHLVSVLILFEGITLLPTPRGKSADSPPMEVKGKVRSDKKIDLFRLKNDDLLKQAQAIYDKGTEVTLI